MPKKSFLLHPVFKRKSLLFSLSFLFCSFVLLPPLATIKGADQKSLTWFAVGLVEAASAGRSFYRARRRRTVDSRSLYFAYELHICPGFLELLLFAVAQAFYSATLDKGKLTQNQDNKERTSVPLNFSSAIICRISSFFFFVSSCDSWWFGFEDLCSFCFLASHSSKAMPFPSYFLGLWTSL